MNLFITLLLLILLFFSEASQTPSNVGFKDAQHLLSFKNSLPNPEILQNWELNSNPCLFTGVSCNNSRVTSINLSFLPLSSNFSSISAHLFPIELLTSVTFIATNLSGSLQPMSVCSSSLVEIDISQNLISGYVSDLSLFNSCKNLNKLNMSFNLVQSSEDLKNASIGLMVKYLDVSSNHLLYGDKSFLPWVLSTSCAHLRHLSLKGNKLTGSFSLAGCVHLEYLDLSLNNFSTLIPKLGRDCPNLRHLDLSSSRFVGEIYDSLVGLKGLSYLNMSNNELSGVFPSLPVSKLVFLHLGSNQFHGVIPESFVDEACSTLVEINLSFNNFSGMIPLGFESCSLVETFDVSKNSFSGELPIDVFLKMGNLKNLNLGFNNFVGTLSDSVSSFASLESLDLSSNKLFGEIPSGICQNHGGSNLKELFLQNNAFKGPIPSTLGNCSQLVSLDLSLNFLTGKIPASFGSLTNLKDLIMWLNQLEGEIPSELGNTNALERLILDYNQLTGTIPSGLSKCSNLNWISLSSNLLNGEIPPWIGSLTNLTILKLSNNSFSGPIPAELGDCKSLLWLDLHSNSLNGSIPPRLAAQSGNINVGYVVEKKHVYLRNNGSKECHGTGNLLEFAGIREEALIRIPARDNCNFTTIYRGTTQPNFVHNGSMVFLDLSYNNLEGSIPKELGSIYYLYILNLGHNKLSGPIPEELGGLKDLGVLDLSYNELSGQIPGSLGGITLLTDIDLSNNKLSGLIPESGQFETFPPSRFANNSGLCGYPLQKCVRNSGLNSSSNPRHKSRFRSSFGGSVAIGLLLFLFCILGLIIMGLEMRKRRKKQDSSMDIYMENNSHSGTANSAWKFTSKSEALSINLATFEKPLRNLTFSDLLEATNGFHDDSIIGKGGFGDVYKAKLKDGSVVAIKKLIHISGQGDREFTAEMETIGKIKHKNLVPLLGYCKVGEERLLVYEYMKYGSLEDVLHDRKKAGIRLNWTARKKIAVGAGRGLFFLHHVCKPHIIHRDMKSSNVLLDENLVARVSDFGMARLMSAMDTHLSVSTLAGTPGYVPPEYYQSFRCSTRGDVYSFGVVLLELLTGKQPTDSADFGDNNNLVGWVKQHAKRRIRDVFDPELLKEEDLPHIEVELLQHLEVACACLDDLPWKRPSMIEVMAKFKEIQAGSPLDSASSPDHAAFATVDVLDMSLKQIPEQLNQKQ